MGVASDGDYGIPKDVIFGYPVTTAGGDYRLVEGLPIDDFSRQRIDLTLKELLEEQDGVRHLV
jgi:malate dehydrogenase